MNTALSALFLGTTGSPMLLIVASAFLVTGIVLVVVGVVLLKNEAPSTVVPPAVAIPQASAENKTKKMKFVTVSWGGKDYSVPIVLKQDGYWHTPFDLPNSPGTNSYRKEFRQAVYAAKSYMADEQYRDAVERSIADGTIRPV